MFSEIFAVKNFLYVPVIMVAAALGTSMILIVLKGLIKGILLLIRVFIFHNKHRGL